jgi:hypothetical protein
MDHGLRGGSGRVDDSIQPMQPCPGLRLLRVDLQGAAKGLHRAADVACLLQGYAQVELAARLLRPQLDRRLQGSLRLCVQSLLAVRHPQKHLCLSVIAVRNQRSGQSIDRLVEIPFPQGLEALLTEGWKSHFRSSSFNRGNSEQSRSMPAGTPIDVSIAVVPCFGVRWCRWCLAPAGPTGSLNQSSDRLIT